ncbi:hypothetical protein RRG08_044547 [Elysia crispata]|uniref:Uncharacterized protein n=1 Tax=Elysia crispata TaxID=231223 RepID=A0AAE0ZDG5_9GAST|nr:hypothetical protein RRG08_044547 [Elysia crispata]
MLRCNMMDLDKSSRDMIFSAHSNLSICSADQDSREAINVSKLYDLAVLEEAVLLHTSPLGCTDVCLYSGRSHFRFAEGVAKGDVEGPPSLASIGQQGSKDYDISQLMKDLYDSMERENDLKDQLKFSEEEAKMMRRRVSDMDEENESLRVQLQRMSEKASKHKKREKEKEKQLEEERKEREALVSTSSAKAEEDSLILVVGADGSDIISGDEPIPVTQRKDSTDEDLMNVMQMRIQLEMLEQELMNSHKKLDEMDLENENLQEEVKFLQGRLSAYESQGSVSREPPPEGSGDAADNYWEEKVRELAAEADDLRWKLIEREREMERMSVTRQHHSGRKQHERLKKSRSLEATPTQRDAPPQVSVQTCDLNELRDLRRQLEHAQSETAQAKKALQEAEEKVGQLQAELSEVKGRSQVPLVQTDDAALENIELRDAVKRLEQSNRSQTQQIKSLTETLQRFTSARDTRLLSGDSGQTPLASQGKPNLDIPEIPPARVPAESESAVPKNPPSASSASPSSSSIPHTPDLSMELLTLRAENLELRRLMAAWGVPGSTRAERRGGGGEGGDRTSGSDSTTNCNNSSANSTSPSPPGLSEEAAAASSKHAGIDGHAPLSEARLSFEEESQEGKLNSQQESAQNESPSGVKEEFALSGGEITVQGQAEPCPADTDTLSESPCGRTQIEETFTFVLSATANLLPSDSDPCDSGPLSSEASPEIKDSRPLDQEHREDKAGEKEAACSERQGEEEDSLSKGGKSHDKREDLTTERRSMEESETKADIPEAKSGVQEAQLTAAAEEDTEQPCKADKKTKESEGGGGEGDVQRALSILERYPEGKSRIVTSGSESRVELMEKVLEMDDEIGDLISEVVRKEEEVEQLSRQVKTLTQDLREARDECRTTELELLQELDMLQDKNSVMSNLLDIINERAEAAEEELERRLGSNPGASASPGRAGSNVSQVSALSDTSTGSDEVFVFQYAGGKEGALTRDWEAKLKGRIESLERLLAEERQKVSTAEKKLILSGTGTVAPSVSDDVKLRFREKELLQAELVSSQHHLQIATDQIKGLRERLVILEDEHVRLKEDYGKLYEEVDAPLDKDTADSTSLTSTDATDAATGAPVSPDAEDKCSEGGGDAGFPFVSKRISVVEAPKFRELRRLKEEEEGASDSTGDNKEEETQEQEDQTKPKTSSLLEELELYKQKARELEFKVEEINDIWKSKSDASEKERDELQRRVNDRTKSLIALEEKLNDLKKDISIKNKIIAEKDKSLSELKKTIMDKEKLLSEMSRSLEDKEKVLQERDKIILDKSNVLVEKDKLIMEKNKIISDIKSAEDGRETLFEEGLRRIEQEYKEQLVTQETLIAQREATIRNLDADVRTRDERLREKDDILRTLNSTLEEHKREMKGLGEKLTRSAASLREKDAAISVLRAQLPEASVLAHDGRSKDGGETDAEKESFRLKAALQKAQVELRERDSERVTLQERLEDSRRALEDAMLMWDKDRGVLKGEVNVLEEKVRLFEMYNPRGGREDEAVDGLKKELGECFQEKEALLAELSTIRLKMDAEQRAHKGELAKLHGELTDKLKMLKSEVDNNARVSVELDRLRRQNELGYRVQQELRVLKADTLALKVRYETRIDKMSKDHNKMLLTIDQLQKERDRDRETVVAIQKNLSLVKDKYTEELLKSEEDKSILGRQRAELDESRGHLDLLQRHLRELKDKTMDQDRVRADLINRFSTERASWEIDRANLNSQINQLREHISCSSKEEGRSKDIQVNMGLAWEKERGEQRRLLQEAHTLALDLQEQLRTRDEASAHDRKELVCQLEIERQSLIKTRRDWERRAAEAETSNRKLTALHARLTELQTAVQKDRDSWTHDRAQLSRQLAEVSNAHARDVKTVEDVLGNLIRLRELGTMALPDDARRGSVTEDQTKTCVVSQAVLDFAKEAVYQMNQAADDLTAITSPGILDRDAIKKISASEMDLVKQEFTQVRHTPDSSKSEAILTSTSQDTLTSSSQHSLQSMAGHVTPRSLTPVGHDPAQKSPSGERTASLRSTAVTTTTTTTTTTSAATAQSLATTKVASTAGGKSPVTPTPAVQGVTELGKQKQKELTKEQQKQIQKELKKKKEEEEHLLKKQKKKTKEGGGLGAIFGRHKADKDSAKTSPSSPQPPSPAVCSSTITTTTTTTSASISSPSTSSFVTSHTTDSHTLKDSAPSVTPRPFDLRRPERPPSYASGTRSAQGSRATTPDVLEAGTWPKQASSVQSSAGNQNYPQASDSRPTPTSVLSPAPGEKPKRPASFSKSISVDSAPVGLDISPSRHFPHATFSHDSQERQQWTAADLTSFFSSLPSPRPSSSPRVPVISLPTATSTSSSTASGLRAHSASPNRDKLSPRSARRKFFDEYPINSTPSPTSGPPSTPTLSPSSAYEDLRRSVSPSRLSMENVDMTKRSHAYQHAQTLPAHMTTSASWDEKMHYRITHPEAENSTANQTTPTTCPASSKPAELSAKEKRKFFKKSSSLDSTPVGVSIAQVGVAAAPVAAPSNFAPSDFFAAVKGRLKPVFKRKSGSGNKESSPAGQAKACSDEADLVQQEAPSLMQAVAPGDLASAQEGHEEQEQEYVADLPPSRERSREAGRGDRSSNSPKGKWRSKSADRVAAPTGAPVHGDIIRPVSGTWKFNETAV